MKSNKILLYITPFVFLISVANAAEAVPTEAVLNSVFGVNVHMSNCCNGNYGNTKMVIEELQYIGARKARDWASSDKIINEWLAINKATGITFHVSIPQTSPEKQRKALLRIERWLGEHPKLIDVIEGSNEADTGYPKSQGASLEDATALQYEVYKVGKKYNIPVAQLSVGGGWKPPFYEGNYKNFGKPPADFGNAHVYLNPNGTPYSTLKRLVALGEYSVDGKPVDITEFGIYASSKQDDSVTSAYMHQAPFDAYLMGLPYFFIYALHDDISGVVGFYDDNGKKRAFADYWHHTTRLLSDPNGKTLEPKNIDIKFENQKSTGSGELGIKNLVMYKSDGSTWIVTYDEEKSGAENGFQTIRFEKEHKTIRVYDGRNGVLVKTLNDESHLNIILAPNHVFLVEASDN
ncbi:MAG: hypothetical protein E6Q61_05470 [Nitrosomonas sp.]|nr:MAG: hypothetical protein E6Q61_05470 [Nitrosomonas sp.]